MKCKLNTIVFFISFFSYMNVFNLEFINSQEKAVLNSADNKMLEKADKESLKAAAKYKDADKIYSDAAAKQSELTSEESDKLNNKAILKQIESINIEFGARKISYEVYATRVELFWLKNSSFIEKMPYARSLDYGAKQDYSTATDLYKEHNNISDNLMKLSKLSDANDNIGKAVDKMKQAFELCANPTAEEVIAVPASKVESQTDSVQVTAAPIDSTPVQITPAIEPTAAPVEEKPMAPVAVEQIPQQETEQPVETPAETVIPQVQSDTTPATIPDELPIKEPVQQIATDGQFFRVQIAASRVPLKDSQLAEIYEGSEAYEERFIGAWYKYTIGTFSELEAAVELKNQCGVKGAFVVQR